MAERHESDSQASGFAMTMLDAHRNRIVFCQQLFKCSLITLGFRYIAPIKVYTPISGRPAAKQFSHVYEARLHNHLFVSSVLIHERRLNVEGLLENA